MKMTTKRPKTYSFNRSIWSMFFIMCFVVFLAVLFYNGYLLQGNKHITTDNVVKRHWQRVGSEDAFVFSAYYKPFEHIVEMVGIVKKTKLISKFNCLFSDREEINATYRYTALLENVDTPPGYISFQTVYIRCTLPLQTIPSLVTLEMNKNSATLPIIYTGSKNVYNISLCFPSFFNNYSNYGRLIDSIESNILFGVQFFTVYKHSVSDKVDKVLDHYVERGLMEVISWNKPDTNIHHDGQWSHIQDCHLSHRYKSKYVMVLDVDELIVPHKHTNLLDMIRDVEKNVAFSPGSYTFRHAFFDVDYDEDISSFPQKDDVEQLQITSLRHVWRSEAFLYPPKKAKTIHVPPRVITAGIHYSMKMVPGFRFQVVDPNIAFLHHYRHSVRVENKTKDAYMRTYTSELVQNVKHVYKTLRFIT